MTSLRPGQVVKYLGRKAIVLSGVPIPLPDGAFHIEVLVRTQRKDWVVYAPTRLLVI